MNQSHQRDQRIRITRDPFRGTWHLTEVPKGTKGLHDGIQFFLQDGLMETDRMCRVTCPARPQGACLVFFFAGEPSATALMGNWRLELTQIACRMNHVRL